MSVQMVSLHSFLWLSNIPLYMCTTSFLSPGRLYFKFVALLTIHLKIEVTAIDSHTHFTCRLEKTHANRNRPYLLPWWPQYPPLGLSTSILPSSLPFSTAATWKPSKTSHYTQNKIQNPCSMSCQMTHSWVPACLLRLSLLPCFEAPATPIFFSHLKCRILIFTSGPLHMLFCFLGLLFQPFLAHQLPYSSSSLALSLSFFKSSFLPSVLFFFLAPSVVNCSTWDLHCGAKALPSEYICGRIWTYT